MRGRLCRRFLALLAGIWLGWNIAYAQTAPTEYQRVTLDQFMRESLVTLVPLSFEIPASYAPVELPKRRPPTALWLERGYHAEALRTGRMPRQAAHFRGSLAIKVTYDDQKARFLCGKMSCEISIRDDLTRAGYRVHMLEKHVVGETQVMLLSAEAAAEPGAAPALLYQAYVPLRAGIGVVQITHRPAPGLATESAAVWAHFKASLTWTPPASPIAKP